ncbi:MAG: N-acetylmuramoyl-L-alanine amidase [Coprothermobacterota bacterium]|nr:N-acetylmuramoyl-L-alanine amidase [Coprothermobacterota bacterium]
MKIGIDAGHGKDGDPGAVGPSGLKEAEVTLSLAGILSNYLACLGQETLILSRGLYSGERAVQAQKEKCDILISLHCNAGSAQAKGIEAWFAHGNEEGKRLASSIIGVLIAETGAVSRGVKDDADWRPSPDWRGGMGILRNFSGPAVLLELLFISNPVEEKLLSSQEFLGKCAHAIACGVLDFINSKGKGSAAKGDDPPQKLEPFPDLSPTLWEGKARKAVLALRDLGILTGYEDGTFRPDQPLTRLEGAMLIYRVLARLGQLPVPENSANKLEQREPK